MSKLKIVPEALQGSWLEKLDGRTGIAQVMRYRYNEFTNDLGGADRLSYGQRALVERALWLEYYLQQQEQFLANGEEFDAARWTQSVNALQGLLSKLGLERQSREVASLHEYLQKRERA